MTTFRNVYDINNIKRAYRWILSNPDARYKNFFRNDYSAYALSSEHNLKLLSRSLQNNSFMPSNACKVFIPKPSGILRAITLLTINDQIAYQACLNIIAESLHPKVEHRYFKSVFYHIYSGKSSPFFYRRWQNCYSSYANVIRGNFRSGFRYIGTFDLTAFYDSIDHHVLRHFLKVTGIDDTTNSFLLSNLKHWTDATWGGGGKRPIYQEHGIPQGPSCSGMLSEVVLQHLDYVGDRSSANVRYLRYVDDIKIMAKDEKTLRKKLVALDIAAKEIGLFPQASKVEIREIIDPEDEIKSVSVPAEPAAHSHASQDTIRARVRKLAPRGHPSDATRLKFVLPLLHPTTKTNPLLLRIMKNRPDLSEAIVRHFGLYKRLPNSLADAIINDVIAEGVYHSVDGDLLKLLYDRISYDKAQKISDFCYERPVCWQISKGCISKTSADLSYCSD